jgi:hypothetical protein
MCALGPRAVRMCHFGCGVRSLVAMCSDPSDTDRSGVLDPGIEEDLVEVIGDE